MNPATASPPRPVPSAGTAAPLSERLLATPRQVCEALARAIGTGDLDSALACFAPGACLVGPNGEAAHGEGAIRALLGGLIAKGARVRIELYGVLVAEDLALAHERWQVGEAPGPASPTMVLRLIAGEWRIAIAAPWGAPATEPLRAIGF